MEVNFQILIGTPAEGGYGGINMKHKKDKSLSSWRETREVNRKLLKLIYRERPKLLALHILKDIWDALTPYAGIYLSALIIEELAGSRNTDTLFYLVAASLLCAALIALAGAFLNRAKAVENTGLYYFVRKLLSDKMLDLDFCITDETETHRALSTIYQNQNGGGWGIYNALYLIDSLVSSLFTLLGGIALTITLFTSRVPDSAGSMAFLNSPLFLLPLLAVMLAVIYLAPMLSNKAESYYAFYSGDHNMANRLFGHFGFLGYNNQLAADIRIYRQDILCRKYNFDKTSTFNSMGRFAQLARGPMGFYKSASPAVSGILTGIIYVFVCLKAWAGAFGVGMMTQYIGAITRFATGLSSLISNVGQLRINTSFVKQVFDFLERPNVMYQGSLTTEKRNDRQYEIEFRDVSFRYPGTGQSEAPSAEQSVVQPAEQSERQYALRHVNLKFRVGQRMAVVGPNGSGKTTFIKLLCRLYDPTEGVILLNGFDIRKYDYQEYLSIFSVVFQDFALTDMPLGENVAAASEYDRVLAQSCLEKAGFGERLKELPHGLDTYLGKTLDKEGVDMSGGEKQKIALARALYKDSPFIVLDEPTAALDPIAEAEIYSRFNEIIEDKTAIYISHRLSSCKFCDEILVFDKGNIVQKGSHGALVSDVNGKYHELWYAQAQYYDENNSENTL